MHNGYFLQEGSIGIYIHLPPGKQPVLRSGERFAGIGRTVTSTALMSPFLAGRR